MNFVRMMMKCLRTISTRGTSNHDILSGENQDRNTGTKNDSNKPSGDDDIPEIPTASTGSSYSTPVQPRRRGAGKNQNDNPYSKYGLNSPPSGPKRKPGRSIEETEGKMREDGFRKYTRKPNSDKAKVVAFLYGRRFYSKSNRQKRVEQVKKILGDREALERAVRLLQFDGDKDTTNEHKGDYRDLNSVLDAYFSQPGTVGFSSKKNKN